MSDFGDDFDYDDFDDDVSFFGDSLVDPEDDFAFDIQLGDRQHLGNLGNIGESDPEEENFDNSPGFSRTLRSLVDLSAFKVARSFPYSYFMSPNVQLPDVLLKRILRYQFPVDSRDLLDGIGSLSRQRTFTDKNIHIVEQIGSVLHGHVKIPTFWGNREELITCTADRGAILTSFCSSCNKKGFCGHVKTLLKLYISKSFGELKISLPVSQQLDVLSKAQLKSVIDNLIKKWNPGMLAEVNNSIEDVVESRELEADSAIESSPYSKLLKPAW